MTGPARLYIHCGMHKTGTTALQDAFASNEKKLKEAGVLVPRAGRMNGPKGSHVFASYSGHHNIAWELTRDRRFHPQRGSIAALATEIEAFSGSVFLSSEDFESLLATPRGFLPLQRVAQATGRRLVLIIYLRNQLSYWESLFPEMLKAGFGDEYDRLARSVIRAGHLAAEEWDFQFDYERLVLGIQQMSGIELIARNYHALGPASVVADVASLLGVEHVLDATAADGFINTREAPEHSLRRFYQNRTGAPPTLVQRLRIEQLCRNLPPLATAPALAREFADRFRDGNVSVCRSMGIPQTGLDMSTADPPSPMLDLGLFFSIETISAVRLGAVDHHDLGSVDDAAVAWWNGAARAGVAQTIRQAGVRALVRTTLKTYKDRLSPS